MTTETVNKSEQAAEDQVQQPTSFVIEPKPGQTTLTKGDRKFEVYSNGNVELNDTGRGIQVKKPEAQEGNSDAAKGYSFSLSDDRQTVTMDGVTLAAPDDGATTIVTDGTVTIVNKEADIHAAAADTAPAADTGIQLTFGDYVALGKLAARLNLNGTEANIGLKNDDVDVYADRLQVKPVTTSQDIAAAASPDAEKIEIRLSTAFNRAVVEGFNNTKVIIELGKNGENDVICTTGTVSLAETVKATRYPAVDVNGDTTRLTLAGGKVFDVNTATGKVTVHAPVDFEDKSRLAEPDPENAENHTIVISEGGKQFAFNGATIEKAADGTIAVATKGKSQIKSFAESPSAVAAAEEKIGQVIEKGWKFLVEADGVQLLVAAEDSGIMSRKRAEEMIGRLRKDNPTVELPDDNTLKIMFANAASIGGLRTEGSYEETSYIAKSGGVFSFKHGYKTSSQKRDNNSVRVVCTRPAQ